ncbi:hybrid sensor histidine kinase/response regulator [Leptolyngbya sp. 7M]|uniref:hybrid sensor histidine kinase/response regulator n=1 Tax=Leptolyngbya sp. 7M TaxID=2812896 RepID=UPI001B8D5448|nr:hybrid sensor histidine kinase/response regulator [Leptolyngbya sp. 7M]QYO62572.1 hybrid sensor histidine kinase/response regulator [Leptolyngbya sp. 7M]
MAADKPGEPEFCDITSPPEAAKSATSLRWLPDQPSDVQALDPERQPHSSNIQPLISKLQLQTTNIQAQTANVQAQPSTIQPHCFNRQSPILTVQAQPSWMRSSHLQVPGFKPAQILLVDDNADMRDFLRQLLSQRWQVAMATNGAMALDFLQHQLPDLIVSDVMMPEMDGIQLLQALRSHPQTQSIPVILLSARAGEAATIEGLATGADDYLIKPFSARELMARVETQLQMARLRQEQVTNRFKDEFLLTVTHELQAPLTAILGWARLLQTQSFDSTTTARALATIERNATIEAKLIKELLDISNLLSGKVQLKSQLVDLVGLVKAVVTSFRAAAEVKNLQLIDTLPNVAQQNVVVDGDRLKQIIAHLLENAIKFTPKGGNVAIHLERLDSVIEIQVSDTGIGIRPEFLPHVFDRFSQAEVPSRHSPGGVGIGLAIARLLVELHHGTIEVASEGEGRGATFMIRLPIRDAEAGESELGEAAEADEA